MANHCPARLRAVATLLAGVALLSACSGDDESPTSTGGATIQQFGAAERVEVESFDARLLDGASVASDHLAGTVVVYNVWGSWCAPCRQEAPDLREVSLEYAEDVRFVGLNVRDDVAAARAFERQFD